MNDAFQVEISQAVGEFEAVSVRAGEFVWRCTKAHLHSKDSESTFVVPYELLSSAGADELLIQTSQAGTTVRWPSEGSVTS